MELAAKFTHLKSLCSIKKKGKKKKSHTHRFYTHIVFTHDFTYSGSKITLLDRRGTHTHTHTHMQQQHDDVTLHT